MVLQNLRTPCGLHSSIRAFISVPLLNVGDIGVLHQSETNPLHQHELRK